MRVRDLDGRTWRVGRRWLPWRRRIRLDQYDLADVSGIITAADDVVGLLLMLVLAPLLMILLPLVVLLLGIVLELALLLALVPAVVGVRMALRRPWTVQVIDPRGHRRQAESVPGWGASGVRIRELSEQVRQYRADPVQQPMRRGRHRFRPGN